MLKTILLYGKILKILMQLLYYGTVFNYNFADLQHFNLH